MLRHGPLTAFDPLQQVGAQTLEKRSQLGDSSRCERFGHQAADVGVIAGPDGSWNHSIHLIGRGPDQCYQ